jgi:hypothetical protein
MCQTGKPLHQELHACSVSLFQFFGHFTYSNFQIQTMTVTRRGRGLMDISYKYASLVFLKQIEIQAEKVVQ